LSDREAILAELREIGSQIAKTSEDLHLRAIRRAELERKLAGESDTSVRVDRIFGMRPEVPQADDGDDEEWRADPFLRFARECGEDYR
jgi:hypothetical protein